MSNPASHIPTTLQRTPCADKSDALGWSVGESYIVDGITVGLRTNEPELLTRLSSFLPAHAQPGGPQGVDILYSLLRGRPSGQKGVKNYHLAYYAWSRLARTMDLEEAILSVKDSLAFQIAKLSLERVYLAASLAEWEGSRLLVAGAEMCAMNRVLAQAGANICDTEFLAVTPQLEVENSSSTGPIDLIVIAETTDRRRTRLIPLSPAVAVAKLVHRSPAFEHRAPQVIQMFSRLTLSTPALQARAGPPSIIPRLRATLRG